MVNHKVIFSFDELTRDVQKRVVMAEKINLAFYRHVEYIIRKNIDKKLPSCTDKNIMLFMPSPNWENPPKPQLSFIVKCNDQESFKNLLGMIMNTSSNIQIVEFSSFSATYDSVAKNKFFVDFDGKIVGNDTNKILEIISDFFIRLGKSLLEEAVNDYNYLFSDEYVVKYIRFMGFIYLRNGTNLTQA